MSSARGRGWRRASKAFGILSRVYIMWPTCRFQRQFSTFSQVEMAIEESLTEEQQELVERVPPERIQVTLFPSFSYFFLFFFFFKFPSWFLAVDSCDRAATPTELGISFFCLFSFFLSFFLSFSNTISHVLGLRPKCCTG